MLHWQPVCSFVDKLLCFLGVICSACRSRSFNLSAAGCRSCLPYHDTLLLVSVPVQLSAVDASALPVCVMFKDGNSCNQSMPMKPRQSPLGSEPVQQSKSSPQAAWKTCQHIVLPVTYQVPLKLLELHGVQYAHTIALMAGANPDKLWCTHLRVLEREQASR